MTEMMQSEWSYLINEDDIGDKTLRLTISPSEDETAALCNRLNLSSIEKLEAKLELSRSSGSLVIHVKGQIEADIKQKCVITLEPVPEHIEESFDAWFSDPAQAVSFAKAKRDRLSAREKEETPILEESDDPEPIIDGKIDLGELVTQYVSLYLDPYPHAPGAHYAKGDDEAPGEEGAEQGQYNNPFAALKDWKDRGGRKDG
ncbi:MAG: DUF177 domain-containing protein [Alphaproteobacteria bacterium]|nr:DUF177 domain-containing protein [Alphaproteobacteria bacterium]